MAIEVPQELLDEFQRAIDREVIKMVMGQSPVQIIPIGDACMDRAVKPGEYWIVQHRDSQKMIIARLTKNSGWHYPDGSHAKMGGYRRPYKIIAPVGKLQANQFRMMP